MIAGECSATSAEPYAAPDVGRITLLQDSTFQQRPTQVSLVVRRRPRLPARLRAESRRGQEPPGPARGLRAEVFPGRSTASFPSGGTPCDRFVQPLWPPTCSAAFGWPAGSRRGGLERPSSPAWAA